MRLRERQTGNTWVRHLLSVFAVGFIFLASVLPARALDDGGGRSVFAYGAGERALDCRSPIRI